MSLFSSLRVRNYRLFASGQVVSLSGTWMQRVAQDWLVLNLSHNSGTAVGITTGLQFAPVLLFGFKMPITQRIRSSESSEEDHP